MDGQNPRSPGSWGPGPPGPPAGGPPAKKHVFFYGFPLKILIKNSFFHDFTGCRVASNHPWFRGPPLEIASCGISLWRKHTLRIFVVTNYHFVEFHLNESHFVKTHCGEITLCENSTSCKPSEQTQKRCNCGWRAAPYCISTQNFQ